MRDIKREHFLPLFCLLLTLFRFSAFGFAYAPLLDDYIQYGVYPHLPNVWNGVLTGGAGTVYTRPLAALADVYLWGKLWENLSIALILVSVLYAGSGILFYKSAQILKFTLSPSFLLVYLFLPLNMEGTYWLSASTRIVTSLFFAAMGIYLLAQFLQSGSGWHLAGYAAFCLLSCGFYEQTAVVSCALGIVIMIWKKRWSPIWIPFLCMGLLAVYYLLLGGMGDNSGRIGILPLAELLPHAKDVLADLSNLLTVQSAQLLRNGLVRGYKVIVRQKLWIWAVMSVIAVLLWGIALYRDRRKPALTCKTFFLRLGMGILLIGAAFAPFFLTKAVWLNYRNIVPALLGFGIIVDAAVRFFLRPRWVQSAVESIALVFCLLVTVSELADYRAVGSMDYAAAQEVARQMEEAEVETAEFTSDLPVYIEQNAPYRDHIMSVFGSYWGISGAVRAVSGNFDLEPTLRTKE